MSIEISKVEIKTAAELIEAIVAVSEIPMLKAEPSDSNGTGYLDGLTVRPLATGVYRYVDGSDRAGVVIATPVGNIVMFQRFKGGRDGVAVFNTARNLRGIAGMLGMSGAISVEQISRLLFSMDFRTVWWLSLADVPAIVIVESILNPEQGEYNIN